MKKIIYFFIAIIMGVSSFSTSALAQVDKMGTPEQVQKMLEDFVASGSPLAEFVKNLQPTNEEIKAVYKEPLASNLIKMYEKMYSSLDRLKKPADQNDVFIVFTTTVKLAQGGEILSKFPGGYGNAREYFSGDFPIVKFEFVKVGETDGFGFDGLIFVNDRWVLMPKPWRGLD